MKKGGLGGGGVRGEEEGEGEGKGVHGCRRRGEERREKGRIIGVRGYGYCDR